MALLKISLIQLTEKIKQHQNRLMFVEVIASQSSVVLEAQCTKVLLSC